MNAAAIAAPWPRTATKTTPTGAGIIQTQRQGRTCQRAHFNFALFDQGQSDGILIIAQKTFGAVNGVQRPEAPGDRTITGVNPAANVCWSSFRHKTLYVLSYLGQFGRLLRLL
jgi:hypothetical protein